MFRKFLILSYIIVCCFNSVVWGRENLPVYTCPISIYGDEYAIDENGVLWKFNIDVATGVISEKVLEDVINVKRGYAIKRDGSLWQIYDSGFFSSNYHKLTEPTKVMDDVIDAVEGYSHSLILKKDGSLWGVGYNNDGELGMECEMESFTIPVKIMDDVKCVDVGSYHSIVLKQDGTVWTFGDNFCGQLGVDKNIEKSMKPIKVMNNAKKIFAGQYSSFALSEDNTLYRWGEIFGDIYREKEMYTYAPEEYIKNVKEVRSFWGFNLVLKTDGSLWVFGESDQQEKVNINAKLKLNIPFKVSEDVNFISESQSCEFYKCFVLKNTGELYMFDILETEERDDKQFELVKVCDNIMLKREYTDIGPYTEESYDHKKMKEISSMLFRKGRFFNRAIR